jgi:error-prone DNA polymerase
VPEEPNEKLYQGAAIEPPRRVAETPFGYAELDVTTNFSFLRGASHPDETVFTSALLGHRAMAVTDVNTVAGVVRAFEAARRVEGFKLIIGARLVFQDGTPDLLVWAPDRAAYGKLCRILTVGRRRAEKGECELRLDDFIEHHEGLIAALAPAEARDELLPTLRLLRDAIGNENFSLAVSCNYAEDNATRLARFAELSRTSRVPLVATNHVHYHDAGRRPLQDVLTCVRHGCTLREAGYRLFPNAERHLKPPEEMHELFRDYPQAIERGLAIAQRCTFSLSELKYEYPDEVVPPGKSMDDHLRELVYAEAAGRYPNGLSEKVRGLLEKELAFIRQHRYAAYFLTVHDLVRYARSRGILCQGRGSAANSAVCFCLGVTSVDPEHFQLVFERFISSQRAEPPDIDIDFEHERREEVIQYVYNKYGRDRAAMTGVVITYRGRSAVRDVGKALGIGPDVLDELAGKLDWWHRGTLDDSQLREAGADPTDPTIRRLIALTAELLGFPRHLSQHVGGLVISRGPLCESVPIENCAMEDRTVIQWDKDDIDIVGMFKVDCLGLGMLTALSKGLAFVNRWKDRDQGIKGSRDQGSRVQGIKRPPDQGKESHHAEGEHFSGHHCVAEGDNVVEGDLCSNAADACGRAVRADLANASGSHLGTIEHRGRVRPRHDEGLRKTLEDFARIAGRVGNPVRIGGGHENDPQQSSGLGVDRRSHQSVAVPHHEPGAQAAGGSGCAKSGEETTRTLTSPPLDPLIPRSLDPSSPRSIELHTIPHEDPSVYDMICDADTIGVFQIESRAQMSMLPRLKPREFYDLVIEVAIVRPGPIQGDMVHPYLQRRNSKEPIEYPNAALEEVLSKTLGVPLFQEQAMRVVMVAASFTAEEADQLRRAMAAWKRNGHIDLLKARIILGMRANGYQPDYAENVFKQIQGFGSYGFPESHAASFAKLVYASAWIKRYHPAAFCAALLNSQPMGFYQPAQLVRDAKEHGVEVREVDVNESEWDCTLEEGKGSRDQGNEGSRGKSPKHPWGLNGPALRLGFRQVKGMREDHARQLVAARQRVGRFTSVSQFHQLTRLPAATLRRLAEADAFGSMGLTRRQAMWQALELKDTPQPLFEDDVPTSLDPSFPRSLDPFLPPMPLAQEVMTDYATQSLSLKQHPVWFVREELNRRRITPTAELQDPERSPHGRWVRVAGLVLLRQRPGTASGVVFETIEDETGTANLILWSHVYDRYRPAARHAALLQAEGYVQREGQVVHVLAKRLFDLSHLLHGYEVRSRDFH